MAARSDAAGRWDPREIGTFCERIHGAGGCPGVNSVRIVLFSVSLAAGTGAAAQTWTLPMSPRATFLRTNSDSPLPPIVLDLAALGIAPGQWLRIGSTGGFRYVNGGADGNRALCAVFSGSATLLASSFQQRVVDALAAGPAFVSANTYLGGLPIDVPQDFYCSRQGFGNGADVEVPAGATHLFLGVYDSLYNDNFDPNGDWGAVVTVIATPALPGTGEHVVLKAAVDATPAAVPESHDAPPGSTMVVTLEQPLGLLSGDIFVLVADVVPTGGQPPHPLPGLWVSNMLLLQGGALPGTADWSTTFSLVTTADFPGTTVIVQGGVLSPLARNGLFETTAAHRFDWH